MIIVNFLIDYIVMLLMPFNSCFIVVDLDKCSLFKVLSVSLIVDFIYKKFFLFTLCLLFIRFIFRLFNIKKKYWLFKNVMLYIVFFNVMFICNDYSNYIFLFSVGFLLYLLYLSIYRCIKS